MEPELGPYREEEDRARGRRRFRLGDRDGGAWARDSALGLGDGGRSGSVKGMAALGLGLGDGVARALGDGGAQARG
jgi:hypothetical protein